MCVNLVGVIMLCGCMAMVFCFIEAADVEHEIKVAQEQPEARIVQLTYEEEDLVTKWQNYEEEFETANECEIL